MSQLNRRRFVQAAAAASTAFPLFTIAGTKASGRVIGANDTIRVGVAGINGRGGAHIDGFAGMDKVEITYLIDPDSRLYDSRAKKVKERGGNTPTCVADIREALDDKSLDAVSVATCNHWHSLITVWACQAGKDVYVEKPISHNVFEGRKCVEAAQKYGRVVQHGTQNRSSSGRAREVAAVQSGKYGKLLVSKGYCCKPRWSIGEKPTGKPPAGLDFNLWLGPAREQPYHGNLVHYNWHWFWETGNGDIGNQGVHEMDVARWAIAGATLPTKVWSLGGRFLPDKADQGETPNMLLSVFEYPECLLVFETRGLVDNKKYPNSPSRMVSNEYYTTEGVIRGGKFYPNGGGDPVSVQGGEASVTPGGPFGAFITAMRSRNPKDNNCDAETAHYSSALCHLGNISYRLGESAKFDQKSGSLGDNRVVVEAFETIKDNLKAVDIRLDQTTYQLGRQLTFDPKTEQFVGDDQANQLLTRPYRAPFVVPDKV
ncbi:MAG: Gfo/Idh/MocA family oxidoreductase [Planctomycetales bacterium]|nr:Gfo/Idh/MocA family oxidoreductase [Planctomycetales bacterium]